MEYVSLFVAAFTAGTLIPMNSEAVVVYLLSIQAIVWLVLLVATVGNTAGGCANYYLGGKGAQWSMQKGWLRPDRLQKGHDYFERWGGFALLLSWAPVVGTPVTLAAGALGYPFGRFLAIVASAKAVRYLVLIAGFYAFF